MFMQMGRTYPFATQSRMSDVPRRLGHFPQKCQRFRANGFVAIKYIKALSAKF